MSCLAHNENKAIMVGGMTSKLWSQKACVPARTTDFLVWYRTRTFSFLPLSFLMMRWNANEHVKPLAHCWPLVGSDRVPFPDPSCSLTLYSNIRGKNDKKPDRFLLGEKISSIISVYRCFQAVRRMVVFPKTDHSFLQMKHVWKIGGI